MTNRDDSTGAPGQQGPAPRTAPLETGALAGAAGGMGAAGATGASGAEDIESREGTQPEEYFNDEAAALLGAGLTPVPPPQDLRARLLAAVAQEPARPRSQPAAGSPGEPAGETAEAPQRAGAEAEAAPAPPDSQEGAQVVALSSRRRRRTWIMQAAAVLVLISAGFGAGRWSAMESMEPTEHYADLNQAQDVQRVTDTMPDGHVATLTWSQDMSMTALSLPSQMMDSAGERSLQVWLRDGQQLTSLGIYDPDSETGFSFLDIMPQAGQEVVITMEPAGGSAQPTSEPLVVLRVGAPGAQST
ncbi:anti-sigma factor [Actinomyces capricornis]|uniref:Anti-sigma K factor RskA C-terminal domain-containing protein n=1 Tax=Actinomyces capricornis TaxID=2755559 RepID=A0ABM7U8L2_9ACTO|nr:anti-sigma factor [Actinomyces capricornis]BDA63781.1 hypothetical protein MANAM107_06150 [Actinomyces capricornis]